MDGLRSSACPSLRATPWRRGLADHPGRNRGDDDRHLEGSKGNRSDEIRAKGPKKEISTDAAPIPGRGLALAQASLYRRHDRPGLFTQVHRITQERKTMLAKTRRSRDSIAQPF